MRALVSSDSLLLSSPGAVQTKFSNVRYKGDDAKANAVYDGIIPLNANDVADSVLFSATRQAVLCIPLLHYADDIMLLHMHKVVDTTIYCDETKYEIWSSVYAHTEHVICISHLSCIKLYISIGGGICLQLADTCTT